jgi:hypothetical protein
VGDRVQFKIDTTAFQLPKTEWGTVIFLLRDGSVLVRPDSPKVLRVIPFTVVLQTNILDVDPQPAHP